MMEQAKKLSFTLIFVLTSVLLAACRSGDIKQQVSTSYQGYLVQAAIDSFKVKNNSVYIYGGVTAFKPDGNLQGFNLSCLMLREQNTKQFSRSYFDSIASHISILEADESGRVNAPVYWTFPYDDAFDVKQAILSIAIVKVGEFDCFRSLADVNKPTLDLLKLE
ncbi:hypothetical protein ACMZOO_08680 [Catenovulum sp. SX2]|uniref:hypothetical protein n=1 Tax=Catenovulum sp. SX2 TaxID=3398614 RepID=UPI003F852C9D